MPLTDLVPFCEQRTGRIICSFAVGHELQGFLQRIIQCDQDRLVQEPCLNSLVVLPEGRHLSLRRETAKTPDQLNLLNISMGESKELVKNPTLQSMKQSK